MNTQQKAEFIKVKCKQANRFKSWIRWERGIFMQGGGFYTEAQPTLADVLHTICGQDPYFKIVTDVERITGHKFPQTLVDRRFSTLVCLWHLGKDALNQQDDATISFIYDLLKSYEPT